MTRQIEVDPGTIGRLAIIVHDGTCYTGQVIDNIAGTIIPKRIRIIHDLMKQGVVLMPGQYLFKDWADDD